MKKVKTVIKTLLISFGFVLIFEELLNAYIVYIADENFVTYYASVTQIARIMNKRGRELSFTSHPYTTYALTPDYENGCNKHNSYGFRGTELGGKKDGEIWIVCIGESTTYDSAIECWQQTYPAQLEKYLREQGVNARVANAGVESWTSYEIMIDFYLRITRFPFDIVIYYGGFNDIIFTRLVHPQPKHKLMWDISHVRWGVNGMLNYPFWEDCTLIRIFLVKLGLTMPHFELFYGHISNNNQYRELISQLLNGTYPSGIFKDLPLESMLKNNPSIGFERNLRNIIALAQKKSMKPLLVSFVANTSEVNNHLMGIKREATDVIYKTLINATQEMNEVIKRISKEYQVPFLDLSAIYPNDGLLFSDFVHNNEEGARIKAVCIGKSILELGLLKK